MKFIVSARKFEMTEPLRAAIEKKIGKLDRYFNRDSTAKVNMSQERGRDTIEVTVNHAGMIFRAQETTGDMYASIDSVVDALERQIRKNKTRLEKRIREGAFEGDGTFDVEEETNFELVKVKKFDLKPMDLDEAILQMNLLGHSFYVFKRLPENETCVVYRRNDGGYGLIEPR